MVKELESIFQPREVQFNSITNSRDYNEMNKELGTDLTNIFQSLARNDIKLDHIIQTLQINNQQLANRIKYLEEQIHNADVDKEYIDFYRSELISYGDELNTIPIPEKERAYINHDYNVATLRPVYMTSKTFLYNQEDNKIFIPDDLIIEVFPKSYTGAIIEENDIRNCLDQDISTQWMRKVIYDINSPVTSVNAQIEITLPKSIINNMNSNTIFINPYPDASLDIVSVEYKKVNSEGFYRFSDENIFSAKDNANSLMISFESKPIEKIKINLRQRNAIDIDSARKMFVLGLQNISIYDINYVDKSSFFVLFEPGTKVKSIKQVTPIMENTDNPHAVTINVFAENLDTGTLIPINIGDNISTNYNEKFWIKVTLNHTDGIATPIMKGMSIDVDLYGQIMGVVKSSYDHSPIYNAKLELFIGSGDAENKVASTNSAGQFEMLNVRPGNYTMKVSHPDYLTAWYNVDVKANRTTNLELIVNTLA